VKLPLPLSTNFNFLIGTNNEITRNVMYVQVIGVENKIHHDSEFSFVLGSHNHAKKGRNQFLSGEHLHTNATTTFCTGYENRCYAPDSSIFGGRHNWDLGSSGVIVGGRDNVVEGTQGSIFGGRNNHVGPEVTMKGKWCGKTDCKRSKCSTKISDDEDQERLQDGYQLYPKPILKCRKKSLFEFDDDMEEDDEE